MNISWQNTNQTIWYSCVIEYMLLPIIHIVCPRSAYLLRITSLLYQLFKLLRECSCAMSHLMISSYSTCQLARSIILLVRRFFFIIIIIVCIPCQNLCYIGYVSFHFFFFIFTTPFHNSFEILSPFLHCVVNREESTSFNSCLFHTFF